MIDTHFNRMFGLLHPMVLSPLNAASDWRVAAAVSGAGGLGLVHVGSQSRAELQDSFEKTAENAVGWGIDVARLAEDAKILDQLLDFHPRAILLYGGDPTPYVDQIQALKVPIICVVENVEMARIAIAAGVEILAAHGNGGAGSGSGSRTAMSLLPEVADAIYASHSETLLLCSGGISDARSIAAALIMGADGVMMGTRFWVSQESSLPHEQIDSFVSLSGDDIPCWSTQMRESNVTDRVWRGVGRSDQWQPVGEGVGMIHDAPSVDHLLKVLTHKTSRLMTHIRRKVVE